MLDTPFTLNKYVKDNVNTAGYIIHTSECPMNENPTKIIVADEKIALYYEQTGYIAFYSISGSYLYGIQTDTSRNGTGNADFIDGFWVIKSRNNTVYFFEEGTLIDSFCATASINYERLEEVENQMSFWKETTCSYNNSEYYIHFLVGAVMRVSGQNEVSVLNLPYNKNLRIFYFAIALVTLAILITYILGKRHEKRFKAINDSGA